MARIRPISIVKLENVRICLSSNCNLHLDSRLDVDDDLLDNLRRGVETEFATMN